MFVLYAFVKQTRLLVLIYSFIPYLFVCFLSPSDGLYLLCLLNFWVFDEFKFKVGGFYGVNLACEFDCFCALRVDLSSFGKRRNFGFVK